MWFGTCLCRFKFCIFFMKVEAVLSPHLAHEIKWQRFVNTKGGMGKNIPCDLYNEFVNKIIKNIIASMGSNLTEDSLRRAARAVSTLDALVKTFDQESDVPVGTSAHSTRSDADDVAKITEVVMKNKLLKIVEGRSYKAYPDLELNPLHDWDVKKTKSWIKEEVKQYQKCKGALRVEEEETEEDDVNDANVDGEDSIDDLILKYLLALS